MGSNFRYMADKKELNISISPPYGYRMESHPKGKGWPRSMSRVRIEITRPGNWLQFNYKYAAETELEYTYQNIQLFNTFEYAKSC